MIKENATELKSIFSAAIENLNDTYTLLKEISGSDSVEILFYDPESGMFHDNRKGTKLETKYLDDTTIFGHAYFGKKSVLVQNTAASPRYTLAIDNPFKIDIQAQIVIPTVFKGKLEGAIRFSKTASPYSDEELKKLKILMGSFREIFLNEQYLHDMEVQKNAFTIESIEVYRSLKTVKATFTNLMEHAENPEIGKILKSAQANVDSLFRYLNPNVNNVSKVKSELRRIKKKLGANGLKVLIAEALKSDAAAKTVIVSITNDPEAIAHRKALYDYHMSKPFIKADVDDIFEALNSQST